MDEKQLRSVEQVVVELSQIKRKFLDAQEFELAAVCEFAIRHLDASLFPLTALGRRVLAINKANGWDVMTTHDWPSNTDEIEKIRKIATGLALIHSEVSEALEALRKLDVNNFEEELADTLIRILDIATGLGIPLDSVVLAKLEKNKTRGIRHGGKAV